jgi:predicted dehydrogenase
MHQGRLHFGVLGASNILLNALIEPAQQFAEVEIGAIASRDQARGRAFAITYVIAY